VLVAARRVIVQEKLKKKMKLRRHRLKIKLSIKIQKVMRGFMVRFLVKKMRQAAVVIPRIWRGYIIRYKQKQAMDAFEGSMSSSESPPARRLKKIVKHRINPDNTEQEYYDYEYDDQPVEEKTSRKDSEREVKEEEREEREETDDPE
jgi:hypothetical protein